MQKQSGQGPTRPTPLIRSYDQQFQPRSDSPEIGWVARDNSLAGPLRTNHNMRINDIGRRCSRQQQANGRRARSIECDQIRACLPNQAGEPSLTGRVPHRLSQRGRRYRYPQSTLGGACDQRDHPAVVPV